MDKLTAIKIKYQDGTYSEQIPIGASTQNIDWDENHSLVDILGEVDLSKGNIQRQINLKPDLGETSSTAYRGDRGKTAYNHATDSNRLTTAKSVGLYKVAATSEGHVSNLTSVTKSDITNLGIPASDANVTQTSSSTNASYEVLFSGTADDTTRTEGARKSSGLTFNPSTKNLTVTKINGVAVGSSPKFTDEDHITTATTSGSGNAVTSVSANNQGALTITKGTTFVTDQDGVSGSSINRFGVCNTGASTAAKTVSITSGTFSLVAGATVAVKFTYTNTANSPTLNVGSTGAKSIYINGTQITSGGNKSLLSGTVKFVYDGTYYNLIGAGNVTGVKGDKESSYRTGNINITPDNIGATMAEELTEAEYNALSESEKLADKFFLITDSSEGLVYKKKSYGGNISIVDADHVIADNGSGTNEALQNLLIKILGNFATIQSSTTASKAYNAGEYFILNSYLYKVKTAIAAGGTINVGTNGNAVQTTVEAEIQNDKIWVKNASVKALTGDILDVSDPNITADYVLSSDGITWGDPFAVIPSSTWSTETPGHFIVTGKATTATTATFLLVKPGKKIIYS